MISFSEFVDSTYFTALEIFLVVFSAQLVLKVIAHANNFPTGISAKRVNAVFYRTKYWLKHISRYPTQAIDMRRAWSVKRATQDFKVEPSMPQNVFLGMLPMIASMGPVLLVNMAIPGKVALRLPFEIPAPFRTLLQYGLPPRADADNSLVSSFGFYFLLNSCATVLLSMIPMANKKKNFYGPSSNYQNYSDLLVTEKHTWELENAEDELLALIDGKKE